MARSDIRRLPASAPGRSHGAAYGGFVFVTATSPAKTGDICAQTRAALELLDQSLRALGADRTRLLSVSVYLTDIADKDDMDTVWLEWIGKNESHWPQRTCAQAALSGSVRVEFSAVAAEA